ncbi:unnamed protein product [Candida verbasci]|uniref:Telomerase reverse transcriptase n=1 Tax=Candida verbasci TaxID=1227364 RepID=A0A9W4TWN3_9ASCO|nr:unnamed protein product [Candida verbasci]
MGIHNANRSFVVDHLKNDYWTRLFDIMEDKNFVDLLINYKGVYNNVQIFGDSFKFEVKEIDNKDSDGIEPVTKFDIIHYRKTARYNDFKLINRDEIMKDVVHQLGLNENSKRFRVFRKIRDKMIENDMNCDYESIYLNLFTKTECNYEKILTNATPVTFVYKFVIVILGKIMSLDAWGGPKNKIMIKRKIKQFLDMKPYEKFSTHELISGLQLSKFKFLGRTPYCMCKQDHETRKKFLKLYIKWIFKMVKRLLKCFWYITEYTSSSDNELYYFSQFLWTRLCIHWETEYVKKFLVQCQITGNERFNFGSVRIIPKVSKFRTICIPSRISINYKGLELDEKAKTSQRIQFTIYSKQQIAPVRQILQLKLNQIKQMKLSYQSTVYSKFEIMQRIKEFKLKNKGKKFFILKFDMMECFDRMDQVMLLHKVQELFKNESLETPYIIRRVSLLDSRNLKMKKITNKIGSNIESFNFIGGENDNDDTKVLVDNSKTFNFTKKDIIDICKSQIFETKVLIKDKWYRRKVGVFQGFPLSSIFCDLLYSSLIDQEFNFLFDRGHNNHEKSMLIRLVDDFLFVSPDQEIYEQMLVKIQDEKLHDYGAYINEEKTETGKVTFFGLQVHNDLSVVDLCT